MLFSVNDIIDFKEETGIYITDRFCIIPFNATFTDENGNREINIEEQLCKPLALQIIATRAIYEFRRVLHNGKFTIPESVEAETKKYFAECNNAIEFCNLYPIKNFIGKKDYYKRYTNWCEENNIKAVCNAQFGRYVISLGYRSERYAFNGVRNTYYANSKFDNDKHWEMHRSFIVGQQAKTISDKLTFDKYLCMKLNEYSVNQDEQVQRYEQIGKREEIRF